MAMAYNAQSSADFDRVEIRQIGFEDLRIALKQGWDDFLDRRGDILFVGIIYPIAVVFAVLFAFRVPLLPIVFPLFAGSALLGPIVATGYYEIAKRREAHRDVRWRHFFDVIRGPSNLAILALSIVLFLLFVVWIICAYAIYASTMGSLPPDTMRTPGEFIASVFSTPEGLRMLVFGNLAGLVFAVVALAMSICSFPMLVDRPVKWTTALRTSVRVALANPATTLTWGLIVVGLLLLGALPAFVGLAVVLPVLGYATWHLYTRAVAR